MIVVERAQRALLKVMFKNLFRHPTDLFYKDSELLSVRRWFVLKFALIIHKHLLKTGFYIQNSQVLRLPIPIMKTTFAKRFGTLLHPFLFNKILKCCDLKTISLHKAKRVLYSQLSQLNYRESEELLKVVMQAYGLNCLIILYPC